MTIVLTKGIADVTTGLIDQIRLACPDKTQDQIERDAGTLMALLDGLILNIVSGQQTADSATGILNAQLDRVFSAPDQGSGR